MAFEPATKRIAFTVTNEYIYTSLADLKEGIYNVYGVITSFTSPRKSVRGTGDFLMTVVIVDPTNPDDGLPINIFAEDETKLPQVTYVGDIFRAHRLKVSPFNGHLQGVGGKASGFSFLVFNRMDSSVFGVSKTCTFTPADRERCLALKLWSETHIKAMPANEVKPPPVPSSKLVALDSIQPQIIFATIAKIIRISQVEGSGTSRRIKLSIWDGTGNKENLTPQNKSAFTVEYKSHQNSTPTYSPISPFGTLLTVLVWHEEYIDLLVEGKIMENSWCTFKGLISKVFEGHLEAKLGSGGSIALLDENNSAVSDRLQAYREKCDKFLIEWNEQRTQSQIIVSTHPHETVEISTISQILKYPEPVYKFRCNARVTGYAPSDFKDFTKPYCTQCQKWNVVELKDADPGSPVFLQCATCNRFPILDYVYVFQLKLEDHTGSTMVNIYGNEASKFLSGLPPVNLVENNMSREVLSRKIKSLLEPDIWLDCCIKSYYIRNNTAMRRYQIFDTTLNPVK